MIFLPSPFGLAQGPVSSPSTPSSPVGSDRRNGIISRFVLPHHRAYRSVHGGSLIYAIDLPVKIRKEDVASLLKAVSGDGSF